MGERYTYQELSAGAVTRVFILGPSETFDAPLRCILQEVFDLGKPPKCDALSYVCGPSTGDQHVLCDGKTMPITKNCELALRYLRDKVQPRTLWVDSICIDQDPKSADKSIQIPRMGDIYQLADRVYVWLGEPSSDTVVRANN
jgi:Heterokaryon incompatibility protein (HET)